MSNHDEIRKLLSAYCGGDLGPAESTRVEEHLAECAPCRAELAELQTVLRLVRTTPESEPPAWLATRIMARVREQQREKQSWWQRIFFPLHVKLPIEFAALLLVCVSGYYLARNMESELQQPAIQHEMPAATTESSKPVDAPGKRAPAPESPSPAQPVTATKKELRTEGEMPALPSAPKAAEQETRQPLPEILAKPSLQPAFAPAPPLAKEAPTDEAKHAEGISPLKAAKRAMPADRENKYQASPKDEQGFAAVEGARGTFGTPPNVGEQQIRVRLNMANPASAPGALREVVTRSGGSVIDDSSTRRNTLKARIPSARMGELLNRLERLGKIAERPQARDLPEIIEIEISW